jgi:hypothetical protein
MRSVRLVSAFVKLSLGVGEFSFSTNSRYQQQIIGVIWEFPNPEKPFSKMGILGEGLSY